MLISFNIADDVGAQFLLAAKDIINNPALTDDQNINRCLKRQIANIIDAYNTKLAISALEDNVNILNAQLAAARQSFEDAARQLESTKNSLNIPPAVVN